MVFISTHPIQDVHKTLYKRDKKRVCVIIVGLHTEQNSSIFVVYILKIQAILPLPASPLHGDIDERVMQPPPPPHSLIHPPSCPSIVMLPRNVTHVSHAPCQTP